MAKIKPISGAGKHDLQESNRSKSQDAKKSTGPKTEEGKARSSLNALKHGLTSQRVWLDEEEEKDFRGFRLGLMDELMPIGSLERPARYEAILERSLTCLLNEYRKIQTDRLRREKQYAEGCRRPGLSLYDPHTDDNGRAPDSLAETEAWTAREITEDFNKDTTIAVRPFPAAGPRKKRERRGGKKPNRGKKPDIGRTGIDKTTARPPLAHPDTAESPLRP